MLFKRAPAPKRRWNSAPVNRSGQFKHLMANESLIKQLIGWHRHAYTTNTFKYRCLKFTNPIVKYNLAHRLPRWARTWMVTWSNPSRNTGKFNHHNIWDDPFPQAEILSTLNLSETATKLSTVAMFAFVVHKENFVDNLAYFSIKLQYLIPMRSQKQNYAA